MSVKHERVKHEKLGYLQHHFDQLAKDAVDNQKLIMEAEKLSTNTLIEKFKLQVSIQEAQNWLNVIAASIMNPQEEKIIKPNGNGIIKNLFGNNKGN